MSKKSAQLKQQANQLLWSGQIERAINVTRAAKQEAAREAAADADAFETSWRQYRDNNFPSERAVAIGQ